MTRIALIAAVLACSTCGGARERMEPEPPWVSDYQRIAREGCQCQDAECLDAAHAAAVTMETEHGGIDDAPPSVQTAHGELDRCWRDGTADLSRDLADAADTMCRCTTAECVEGYRVEIVQIEDKYSVSMLAPDKLDPGARAELARATACLDDVTIPAPDYLVAMRKATEALCKCEDAECVKTEITRDPRSFGNRFYIADVASIQLDLESTSENYCECYKMAVEKVLKDAKLGTQLEETQLKKDMHCKK